MIRVAAREHVGEHVEYLALVEGVQQLVGHERHVRWLEARDVGLLDLDGLRGVLWVGDDAGTLGPFTLPLSLSGPFGAPGCELWLNALVGVPYTVDVQGNARARLAIPNANIVLPVRMQWMHPTTANALGLAFTDARRIVRRY